MNYHAILAVVFGVVATLLSLTTASTVPMIYCQPNSMSDAPAKVRQLCFALMERVEAPQEDAEAMENPALYGRGIKRQDVDHVFLRFGRRLGL